MPDNIIIEYGKVLKQHAIDLCRKADSVQDPSEAKRIRGIASAVEWAVEMSVPRFTVMDFNILYRAAQESSELYNALVETYGSEDNVEIAARMRGLHDE